MAKEIKDGKKLSLRGRTFTGTVTSTKMANTITIEWGRSRYIPKYERYDKRKTRIHAHLPSGIQVGVGDIVKVAETRPISKTKNFIFVEKVAEASVVPSVKEGKAKNEPKKEKTEKKEAKPRLKKAKEKEDSE